MSRTAPLTSKRYILYIYSTNIGNEYFKHALYSPFFSLQSAVCFIMLTCLVPVLFTIYIQGVLKLKKNNFGAKGLRRQIGRNKFMFVFSCAFDIKLQVAVIFCHVRPLVCLSVYLSTCLLALMEQLDSDWKNSREN